MPLNRKVWSHLSHKEGNWESNQHGRQWLNLVWLVQNEVLEWPQGDVLLAWILLLCIESDQHEILFQRWLDGNLRKTDAFWSTQKAFKSAMNFMPKLAADLSQGRHHFSVEVNENKVVGDRNSVWNLLPCYAFMFFSVDQNSTTHWLWKWEGIVLKKKRNQKPD